MALRFATALQLLAVFIRTLTQATMTKAQNPKPKTHEICAILLAAGRSQRMGAFKPLLPFGETTVINTCIQNLRDAGIDDIVVVLGHRADEVKQSLNNLNLNFAINPNPDSEMSASIACGVKEISKKTKVTLLTLSDQPAIPADVVNALVKEWKAGEKLVIPEFQGRGGHPVLIDLCFREELVHLDPSGGLKSFFDAHKSEVKRLAVSSPYIARDLDTWDDYRALHTEIFGIPPTN
ncbi:MAG: nucleotidyltransferase family protein [Pyrinomonadaceae bacterium]